MAEPLNKNTIKPAEILRAVTEIKALERDMIKADAKRARIRGLMNGIWRNVKRQGGDKEIIREAMRLRDMDESEALDYQRGVYETTKLLGRQLWTPGDGPENPFDFSEEEEAASAEHRYQRIKTQGFQARAERDAKREEADQMFEPGSPDHEAWTRGWIEADEADFDAAKPVKATPKTKDGAEPAAPKRRGRPPGSGKKAAAEPSADPIGETQGNA